VLCLLGSLAVFQTGAVSALAAADASDGPAPPTSWRLGLRSTGYFYQLRGPDGARDDRYQSYQTVTGSASGLAGGLLTLRGAGRYAGDPAIVGPGFSTSRLYTGYLEARPSPEFEARLGRQYVAGGLHGLTLDGLRLSLHRGSGPEIVLWGGARAPLGLGFDPGDLEADAAAGARIAFRPGRRWQVALTGAYRERLGRVAEQPVGLEAKTTLLRDCRLLGRAVYDLEQSRLAKTQLLALWQPRGLGTSATLQLISRSPGIDAASWFARFADPGRIRVARAAIRHRFPSRYGGELEIMGRFSEERRSTRVGAALLLPLGRIGYALRQGDAGEASRLYGEIGHRPLPWLETDARVAVSAYALLEDAPADLERDLVTMTARLRATLRPGLRLLAQVQSLDNPVYAKDVRLLIGVDMSMAGGATRYGLGRGGWLR